MLQPYIDTGEVVYKLRNGDKWAQIESYSEAIENYKNETKWLAFIDIDEFIVPLSKPKIQNVIEEVENAFAENTMFVGLAVHSVFYGYSGHLSKPTGLVIENYRKNDGIKTYKSIVNPRTVISGCGAHSFICFLNERIMNEKGIGFNNESISRADEGISESGIEHIRINHYWTKSYEEFCQKMKRNNTNPKTKEEAKVYSNLPPFAPNYLSKTEDTVMDRYVQLVKEKLDRG